jgi:four helix bundle protein
MTTPPIFWHEKLDVYRLTLAFASRLDALLLDGGEAIAAVDHLCRATESILVNLANGNATWSPEQKQVCFGTACGSGLECAACLDVCCARQVLSFDVTLQQKRELQRVVQMLVGLVRSQQGKVREDGATWDSSSAKCMEVLFSHERLDVYQTGLEFVRWVDKTCREHTLARSRSAALDDLSTSVVLNIAEGNGRFTARDHRQFADIAHRAALKSAVTLDMMAARKEIPEEHCASGKELLGRIVKMLLAMRGYLEHEGATEDGARGRRGR